MARKIRVKIEMDLLEGQDFPSPNSSDEFIDGEQVIANAEQAFVDMLNEAEWEPFDWIQSKLIEGESNG